MTEVQCLTKSLTFGIVVRLLESTSEDSDVPVACKVMCQDHSRGMLCGSCPSFK